MSFDVFYNYKQLFTQMINLRVSHTSGQNEWFWWLTMVSYNSEHFDPVTLMSINNCSEICSKSFD
jgi:hypothetical protein